MVSWDLRRLVGLFASSGVNMVFIYCPMLEYECSYNWGVFARLHSLGGHL